MWEDGGVVWSSDGAPFAVSWAKKEDRSQRVDKECDWKERATRGEGGGEGGMRARTRDADEKERSGRSFTDKGDNQQSNSVQKRMECWSRET